MSTIKMKHPDGGTVEIPSGDESMFVRAGWEPVKATPAKKAKAPAEVTPNAPTPPELAA